MLFSTKRRREYFRLEKKIESSEFRALLATLQQGSSPFGQFDTWGDVVAFMRAGTPRDPRKDEVLRPILLTRGKGEDERCWTILLAVFWPRLLAIHRWKRHWDKGNPDELWQRVCAAFLESIHRINLERRPHCLAQWVLNTTINRLYAGYEREWKHAKRECATDPDVIQNLARAAEEIELAGIVLRDEYRRWCCRLWGYVQAGLITESDFYLILGTRIYGQPVSEYARQVGVKPDTARKRRIRAEAAIRRHERRSPESIKTMSRPGASHPLLLADGDAGSRREVWRKHD
jgi:hypothetical protein